MVSHRCTSTPLSRYQGLRVWWLGWGCACSAPLSLWTGRWPVGGAAQCRCLLLSAFSSFFLWRHPTLCEVSLWIWGLGNLFCIGCIIIHCHYIQFDGDIVSHSTPLFLEHFVTSDPRDCRFSWCFPYLGWGQSFLLGIMVPFSECLEI